MITINPEKLVRNVSKNGEFIFRGGLALQAELGAQNVERYRKFLTTPKGQTFLLQQTILQAQNAKRGTRIYNPLAPIIAKGLGQEFTKRKPKRHVDIEGGIGLFRNLIGRGEPRTSNENAVKFFDNRLKKQVDLQVRYGGELNNLDKYPNRKGQLGEEVKDFIKFRIRDAVNGRYIIFPALISEITDNSSAEVSPISYIGRADKVHIYGGYSRSISFSINVVAQREGDIPIIWEKINYAKGLVLPQYKQFFGKTGVTDNTRPVAPIIYLTLGDLFNNSPGFFTSVNLTIPQDNVWELTDGSQVPHLCQLSFEFTYIGKENPTMTSKHYDNISNSFPFEELPEDNTETPSNKQLRRNNRKARREKRQARRQQRRLDRKSFGDAFKKKQAELGPNKTFTWRGKSYTTNTA